jgi:small-conductance mechanosensitive channel
MARPHHAWSAVLVAVSLAVAWVGARVAGHAAARRQRAAGRGAAPAGTGGLRRRVALLADSIPMMRRLLFALFSLVLLWAGEGVLRWQHVITSAADARLLHLAMWLMGAIAAARVLFALLHGAFGHPGWAATFDRTVTLAAAAVVALYATGGWDDVVGWLQSTVIPLGAAARVSLWSILVGGFTMLVAVLAALWLGSIIERRLNARTSLEPNLRTVLARVAKALLLVTALLLALALSGIDLTILSVFGGALGVGLGLGLQRIASNYVSGFILLLDRSLRIGDLVTVDKFYGRVAQISTRYTVLEATDGTEAIVPNEMLVSSPVINHTLASPRMVLSFQVAVAPDTDLPRACALLSAAALKAPRVLRDPAPVTLLKEIQAGNLVLEVGFWIADPENGRAAAQSDVGIALVQCLRESGIRLAAPRGEIRVDGPAAQAS